MTFSLEQTDALKAPLNKTNVKQRKAGNGMMLSYVEAWHAIAEANRIFGFDRWDRETVDLIPLSEARMVGDKYRVGYRAKVKITVYDQDGNATVREGCGFGSGIDKDADQAHESALKEAESDAMKRAFMTFGNPFGLALYDKAQANVTSERPRPNPPPGVMTGSELQARQEQPSGRKSSAQAKRDGDHDMYMNDIAKLDEAGIVDWTLNFDQYTADAPISWLDPLRDKLELRREEIMGERSVAGEASNLDEAFRATMGSGGPAPVSGRNAPHHPAR